MERLKEIRFSWPPVEKKPDLLWAPMEQFELSWAPVEQHDQGLHRLLADQQLRLASAAAIGLKMKDNPIHDYDATMILQLLKEPRDERDLNECLSGDLLHSPLSQETNVNPQVEFTRSHPGGTHNFPSNKRGSRKKRMSPWMEVARSHLGGTRNFPSKKRGARKKSISPWDPLFFEMRRRSTSVSRVCTHRKNNSHWTHEEVELLVKGISKYGIGKWTELKGKYFKQSIRTSVNLKDKWRNLLKAYDVKLTSKTKKKRVQKMTLLHLEQPLIKQIKELGEKHRRGYEAAPSNSSNTSINSFLIF